MERQMGELQARLEQAQKNEEQAAELSRSAFAQAFQAQQSARAADAGKTQAEDAKAEAVKDADQARQTAASASEEAKAAREEADQIKQRREAELERLQNALEKIGDTQRTTLGLVMTLGSDSVKFDFDKADLRPENRELLSRIAGVLLTAYGFRIQVFGHTDDVGTDQYNQTLSERRAQAVRDYLVQAGVSPDIMTARGFGKSSPRVPSNGPEARSKNRRVEIGIVDSVINYGGEVAQQTPHQ
jgi:outer membrane protein OmpA-like peptidoglycan-associated protein